VGLLYDLKEKNYWEDLDVRGVMLKWILENLDVKCGVDLFASGYGPVAGSFERGKKHLGSIKC
jgi:hypothetical protein